ncbi:MAG TPA: c-type cytochrome [Candidatus Desulfobacillus sp.]|nr:c-type cytochrome [Candidatus Desulfobacillus sp.]
MIQRFILLALAVAFAATTEAADSAPNAQGAVPGSDPGKGQKIAAEVCAACHNPDGNSAIAQNPKLAGQHAAYLYKQLRNFHAADGKAPERVNAIMNGMVAGLSDQDMKNVAAFYSSQALKPEQAKSKDFELAQKLYRGGDAARGLPACAGCHGAAGAGIPDEYPRIGGQFAEYSEAQLKAFRNAERGNDPNRMMRLVAARLSDAEIKALADYLAGLH